jgi:hypothetical protein
MGFSWDRYTEYLSKRGLNMRGVYDKTRDMFGEGVPVETQKNWRKGSEPGSTNLLRVAAVLEVNPAYLMEFSDDPELLEATTFRLDEAQVDRATGVGVGEKRRKKPGEPVAVPREAAG